MKFEVFDESGSEKYDKVTLRLIHTTEGDVSVVAVDQDGKPVEQGKLVLFRQSGRLLLVESVNPDLGFALTSRGEIVTL